MRPHVLVVDDTPAIRELASNVLEAEGYRVTAASSGTEGLAAVDQILPDLVVCAVVMPEMDGWSLLERLRADPRCRIVPVVLRTALGDPTSVERGTKLGVDHYLVKPFAPGQLLATVRGTLRRHAELRQANVVRNAAAVPRPPDIEPTGIAPVDDQLGGLPRGRVYLVRGGIGAATSVLGVQFLHEALVRGEPALLVTTDRLDTILYVGASTGLELRDHVRDGRLVVLGLSERFEQLLGTRADLVALTAELAGWTRDCGARRIVVSSVLTLLCATPHLPLSTPAVTDLVAGLEQTGATTLLIADDAVTHHEALAEAYLGRTVFGTITLQRDPTEPGLCRLRLARLHGLHGDPAAQPFRVAHGVGLVSVDPGAEPDVFERLDELRRGVEVKAAAAEDGGGGLAPLPDGGQRLRDPFVLYLRDCLATADRATAQHALVLVRFTIAATGADTLEPTTAVGARDLDGALAQQEILCWTYPGEIVVLALGADRAHARGVDGRLRDRLAELATRRGARLIGCEGAIVAQPEDGGTLDALLDALGHAVAAFAADDGTTRAA